MQQFLYIILFSLLVAGCNDNSAATGSERISNETVQSAGNDGINGSDEYYDTTGDVNVDTLGMARFLALKAHAAKLSNTKGKPSRNSMRVNGAYVDTTGWAQYSRLKSPTARKAYEDSMLREEIIAKYRKRTDRTVGTSGTGINQSTGTNRSNGSTAQGGKQNTTGKETTTSTDQQKDAAQSSAQTKKKKGVSNKAKGAVIGAATGAAAGAVINKKNRTAGGIIGGILGAAAGYGIGRHKDKTDTTGKTEIKKTTDNKDQ